jgi:threonine/homoserine/homoserine lactone efflux protein
MFVHILKLMQGMGVGFSIAAPVGAIGFLCIQQTLTGGILLGLASGLGAATADMMYGILVALGMTASQTIILSYKIPLSIIGGLFLCYLGLKKFWAVLPSRQQSQTAQSSLLRAYGMTFLLTLTNPATILDFAALFAGLRVSVTGYVESLSFVGGVFVGSACWWLLLCFTVGIFRKRVSQNILRYINYGAGIVILSFGLYALSGVLR